MKTEQEINETRDQIHEYDETRYPSMSYEQGMADALDWVLDQFDGEDLLE